MCHSFILLVMVTRRQQVTSLFFFSAGNSHLDRPEPKEHRYYTKCQMGQCGGIELITQSMQASKFHHFDFLPTFRKMQPWREWKVAKKQAVCLRPILRETVKAESILFPFQPPPQLSSFLPTMRKTQISNKISSSTRTFQLVLHRRRRMSLFKALLMTTTIRQGKMK